MMRIVNLIIYLLLNFKLCFKKIQQSMNLNLLVKTLCAMISAYFLLRKYAIFGVKKLLFLVIYH